MVGNNVAFLKMPWKIILTLFFTILAVSCAHSVEHVHQPKMMIHAKSASQGQPQSPANASAIQNYISNFTRVASSSPILSANDVISKKGLDDFRQFLQDYAFAHYYSGDFDYPYKLATYVAQPIVDCFDSLPFQVILRVYVKGMANFLYTHCTLDENNAGQLAQSFAKYLNKNVRCSTVEGKPETKYFGFPMSFQEYLRSLGLFSKENFVDMSFYYREELLQEAQKLGHCSDYP